MYFIHRSHQVKVKTNRKQSGVVLYTNQNETSEVWGNDHLLEKRECVKKLIQDNISCWNTISQSHFPLSDACSLDFFFLFAFYYCAYYITFLLLPVF